MKKRLARSLLLIALALFVGLEVGNLGLIPSVKAAGVGTAPAILGLFNENRKSSTVIDSTLVQNSQFIMDVNVTDAGSLKAIDVNITWTTGVLTFANSTYSGRGCPAYQGCVFAAIAAIKPASGVTKYANTTAPNSYHLFIADTCSPASCPVTVGGDGVLFRVAFKVAMSTPASTVIHINLAQTTLQNPGAVPFLPVDGYFDNQLTPTFSYSMGGGGTTTSVTRTVVGTSTSTALNIPITGAVGTPSPIVFRALGLPSSSTATFTPTSCTPSSGSCTPTPTVTITVSGSLGNGPTTRATPSGIYAIAIIGNSSLPVGNMVNEAWITLIVQPPSAPLFTLTDPAPAFSNEAGTSTLITLTATLLSGSNDTISEDVAFCPGGLDCSIKPGAGDFSMTVPHVFTSVLNVTSPLNGVTGVQRLVVSATTGATYSEVTVRQALNVTLTVTHTHDLILSKESMSSCSGSPSCYPRNFAYALVPLGANPLKLNGTAVNNGGVTESSSINATVKVKLVRDTKIGYIDTDGNAVWDPGETVIYDSNGDGKYSAGTFYSDIVIAGTAPANNTALQFDSKILFVDRNYNGHWDSGESVVYDTNGDGAYESGKPVIAGPTPSAPILIGMQTLSSLFPIDPVVTGSPTNGTGLSTDPVLKFVDLTGSGVWAPGDPIVYDASGTGVYVPNDAKLKFVDFNGTGVWGLGKPVVYDTNGNGLYVSVDPRFKFVNATNTPGESWSAGKAIVYDSNNNGKWQPADPKLKYVDALGVGHWVPGDPVIYDVGNTGFYATGDNVLSGGLAGSEWTPAIGTALSTDLKIRFVDSSNTGAWSLVDSVVYDSDNNGIYDSGEPLIYSSGGNTPPNLGTPLLGEPVILGTAPTVKTAVIRDLKLTFVDAKASGKYDSGDTIVYDTDNNRLYDASDIVVLGTTPAIGTPLQGEPVILTHALVSDPKIKFVDKNGNNVWDPGETVIYDTDNSGTFTTGDVVIAGLTPPLNTALKTDKLVKFIDPKGTGVWNAGEPVIYDMNNDNTWDSGDPLITQTLTTDSQIRFVDTSATGLWHAGETVVYDINNDAKFNANDPVIAGTMPTVGTALTGDVVICSGCSGHAPPGPGVTPDTGAVLKSDAKLKYVDANSDGVWDNNEAVVYDLSNLGKYYDGSRAVTFNVDPSSLGLTIGNYLMVVTITPVAGQLDTSGVSVGIVSLKEKLKGDVNGDGVVDIVDLSTVGGQFGKTKTSTGFNPNADLNNDGVINIQDLVLVATNFGQHT